MAEQHYSISNHSDSSMEDCSIDISNSRVRSDPGPRLRLSCPVSPLSTPTTQIFNPLTPSSPLPSPHTDSPVSEMSQDITKSLPETLKLTQNIIAALDTYIGKMRADLKAKRMLPIAIYEIRCAERYQSVLRMKAHRMELIQAVLDRYIAEHGDEDLSVRWEDGSQLIWAQELEYVRKARKYLIDSHVFYKINHTLAP